ncbi:hypothetical protein VTH82DRAFT_7042 [Thermothelomyces myriococcoides]
MAPSSIIVKDGGESNKEDGFSVPVWLARFAGLSPKPKEAGMIGKPFSPRNLEGNEAARVLLHKVNPAV